MDRNNKFRYNTGNHNAAYNNPRFIAVINYAVSEKFKRTLSESETRFIVNSIRKLDENYLRTIKPKDIVINLSEAIYKKMVNTGSCPTIDDGFIDMHEELKKSIGQTDESNVSHSIYDKAYNKQHMSGGNKGKFQSEISNGEVNSILGISSTIDLVKQINPKSLIRKQYMYLDSRYRNKTGSQTKFIWDYSNDKTQQDGTVCVIGNVRDVVALRLYDIRLPYTKSADTKHKRISMLIEEFSSQSFYAHENRRFHFMLNTSIDGDFIDASSYKNNEGYYHFSKPITTFTSITVSFANPLQKIEFDNDTGRCSIDYFGIAPLTQITTVDPHTLSNGDLVYFSNFRAGAISPLLTEQIKINNLIISTMNKSTGFVITVIDANNFSINYDTSNIQNPIAGLEFDVYYDVKRFYIPIELSYLHPVE